MNRHLSNLPPVATVLSVHMGARCNRGLAMLHRAVSLTVLVTVSVVLNALIIVGPASAAVDVEDVDLVSVATDGTEANGASANPAVSADGSIVAYQSEATNLVPGDTNNASDVFVHDTTTGVTTRVSVATDGTEANGGSANPAVSADGSIVAYQSEATNLVPGDTNSTSDVFVHDTTTGVTTRVSVATDGTEANGGSANPAVSADGSIVVYQSEATNLLVSWYGIDNGASDVFKHDTTTGVTTRVSVKFQDPSVEGNGGSVNPAVGADGSVVAYQSEATNVSYLDDRNGASDVFYSGDEGSTRPVSVDYDNPIRAADGSSVNPVFAAGVVYQSEATNLVRGDSNATVDVFWFRHPVNDNRRVSVASEGTEANGASVNPAAPADGSVIVYQSEATNLVPGDTNSAVDVFLHDTTTGVTARVSIASDGTEANGGSVNPAVSADGSLIAYQSEATNLVPGDNNGQGDIFVARVNRFPFVDDDDSVFEDDIRWLASEGITRGCNPPVNDLFCPDDYVTRGQMAAFLHRALDGIVEPSGDPVDFTDDDDSTFIADIAWLSATGITKGCSATEYCPAKPVTRGQMAAFLVRALGYTDDGGGNLFVDDDDSIFEADIDKLAAAGVTRGCNPPHNTMFCPGSFVTRGQMAAFLHRALG